MGVKAFFRNIITPGWLGDPVEAEQAVEQAGKSLEEALARTDEVQQIVQVLDREYEVNHFIDRLNMHVRRGHT